MQVRVLCVLCSRAVPYVVNVKHKHTASGHSALDYLLNVTN